MDSEFPMINEYGILKLVLSHLNIKDLIVVSKVNSNWKKVAEIIIKDHVEISCSIKEEDEEDWPELNKKIRPKVIFYNNGSDKHEDILQLVKSQLPGVGGWLKKHYAMEEISFIYIANWKFINSIIRNDKIEILHSSHCRDDDNPTTPFKESLVMIPEFSGLKIDVEYFNMYSMKTVEKDYTNILSKVSNSKSCLFLTNADLKNKVTTQIIKIFCEKAQEQGSELVMAGGISHFMMCYEKSFVRVGGAVITFSGNLLSAKSFVISLKDDLTNSFEKMKEELGPLKTGYMRLAFIFTCVDRYKVYEDTETEEFTKFFPDVLVYGFWSLGEFCHGYTPFSEKQRKKPNSNFVTSNGSQFFFQQASTYLFLTFNK